MPYIFYRPNKNASRTDITNDGEKAYAFVPTYGDESTASHCHIISVVVFFYPNTHQIMLVDYAITQMGSFDDYLDAALRAKTKRVNGNTTFLLHVTQCITFHQQNLLQKHLLPRHR